MSLDIMGHLAYRALRKKGKRFFTRFRQDCSRAEALGEEVLMGLIRKNKDTEYGRKYHFDEIQNIDDFREKVPISTFDDYSEYIERMVAGESNLITSDRIDRYYLTSGSMGKPHRIPVSNQSIAMTSELIIYNQAYIAHEYLKKNGNPKVYGKFLSLIPVKEYDENGNVLTSFSGEAIKHVGDKVRILLGTPMDIFLKTGDSDINYLFARFALANRDIISICAVYSNAISNLISCIEKNKDMLIDDIRNGTISKDVKVDEELRAELEKGLRPDPKRADELAKEFDKGFNEDIINRIWPKISWIVAVGTGDFAYNTELVKKHVSNVPWDNVAYCASEAVMGITTEMDDDTFAMYPRFGFFEYIPIDDEEKILLSKDLEIGKEYEVVVTNLSGFYRYRMGDVVEVTGFEGGFPRIRFKYRKNLMLNICGEKTNSKMISYMIDGLNEELGCKASHYSVYSEISEEMKRYCVILEETSSISSDRKEEFLSVLERRMAEANPYFGSLVRDRKMSRMELDFVPEGTYEGYRQMMISKGLMPNQIKPPTVLNTEEKKDFFISRIIRA